MVDAPFCSIETVKVAGKPQSPKGIRPIPPNTPPNVAWHIINNNFHQLVAGNFTEINRQTTLTRIYDPADHNVFVDVRQITGIQFGNSLTGQTITWHRGAQPNPPAQPTGTSFGG